MSIVKEWVTKAGYRAKIILNGYKDNRWYCGYVEVPTEHPLYGLAYSDKMPAGYSLPEKTPIGKRGIISVMCVVDLSAPSIDVFFDVHGSITYSGSMGKSGEWWFGFDCNHVYDTIESCDEAYVKRECESLARQLEDLELKIKHKDGTTLTLADEALILLKELQEK